MIVITKVTVLGAGTMGHGIAHAAMMAGCDTVLYDVAPAAVEKGRRAIGGILEEGIVRGNVTRADAAAATARLTTTTSLAGALSGSRFIIEAAEQGGRLQPGGTIVERVSTSGPT